MVSIVEEFRDIDHLSITGLKKLKASIVEGINLGVVRDDEGLKQKMEEEQDKDRREAMQIAFDLASSGRMRDLALHIGNIGNRIDDLKAQNRTMRKGRDGSEVNGFMDTQNRRDMERMLIDHATSLRAGNGRNGRQLVPVRRV